MRCIGLHTCFLAGEHVGMAGKRVRDCFWGSRVSEGILDTPFAFQCIYAINTSLSRISIQPQSLCVNGQCYSTKANPDPFPMPIDAL